MLSGRASPLLHPPQLLLHHQLDPGDCQHLDDGRQLQVYNHCLLYLNNSSYSRFKTLSLTYSFTYIASGLSLLSLAVLTIIKMKQKPEVIIQSRNFGGFVKQSLLIGIQHLFIVNC